MRRIHKSVTARTHGNVEITRDGLAKAYPEHRFNLDIKLNEGYPKEKVIDALIESMEGWGYTRDPSWTFKSIMMRYRNDQVIISSGGDRLIHVQVG